MSFVSHPEALDGTPLVSGLFSSLGRLLSSMSDVVSRDHALHMARELRNIGGEVLPEFDVSRTLACTPEQMSEYAPLIRAVGEGLAQGAELLERQAAAEVWRPDLKRETNELRRISAECLWLSDRLAHGRHSIILSAEARETLSRLLDDENDGATLQSKAESAA